MDDARFWSWCEGELDGVEVSLTWLLGPGVHLQQQTAVNDIFVSTADWSLAPVWIAVMLMLGSAKDRHLPSSITPQLCFGEELRLDSPWTCKSLRLLLLASSCNPIRLDLIHPPFSIENDRPPPCVANFDHCP